MYSLVWLWVLQPWYGIIGLDYIFWFCWFYGLFLVTYWWLVLILFGLCAIISFSRSVIFSILLATLMLLFGFCWAVSLSCCVLAFSTFLYCWLLGIFILVLMSWRAKWLHVEGKRLWLDHGFLFIFFLGLAFCRIHVSWNWNMVIIFLELWVWRLLYFILHVGSIGFLLVLFYICSRQVF